MGVSEIQHSQEVSSGLGASSETLRPEEGGSRLAWGLQRHPTPGNTSGPGRGLLMIASETAPLQEGKLGLGHVPETPQAQKGSQVWKCL